MSIPCPTPEELVRWLRLPVAELQPLAREHLESCPTCAAASFRAAASSGTTPALTPRSLRPDGPALEKGTRIGRYVVLEKLGEGGMGVVLGAFDPELDRRVAVKLLQERGNDAELLKEAQAMAKLAHPNVVAIHDVGRSEQGVFLAMEWVQGNNLREYLRAHPELSIAQRLRLFLEAGEGLVAAHARNLIHRDFKPDNVLVDEAGRVRVMDFGLARLESEPSGQSELRGPSQAEPHGGLLESDARKTKVGQVKGTPAYLAPEQLKGEMPTAAVDQFAFAVSLYEALYGRRPFQGMPQQRGELARWKVEDAPAQAKVPAWLRRVLMRALAEDPLQRYPSLAQVLSALRADPTVLRRRYLGAAALLVLLVAGLGLLRHEASQRDLLCKGAERHLVGVWDLGRKGQLQTVFAAHPTEATRNAWENSRLGLDRFADGWVRMRTEACEATRLRGEQSEQVFTLRMTCLDKRLEELHALTDVLTAPGQETAVLLRAPEAVNALSPLGGCADVEALRSEVPLPGNPADRERMQRGTRRLLAVKSLFSTGKEATALQGAREVLADAKEHHLGALAAQAQYWVSRVAALDSSQEAAALIWQAMLANLATHQDAPALELATLLGNLDMARGDEAAAGVALELAQALLERLPTSTFTSAGVVCARARRERELSRFTGAVQLGRECLELVGRIGEGSELEVAELYNSASAAFQLSGYEPQSVEAAEHALELRRRITGDLNLRTLTMAANLTTSLVQAGLWSRAIENGEKTRAELTRLAEPHPLLQATNGINLGEAYLGAGHFEQAAATFTQTGAVADAMAEVPPLHVIQLSDLGLSQLLSNHELAAAGSFQRARVLAERYLPADDDNRRRASFLADWVTARRGPASSAAQATLERHAESFEGKPTSDARDTALAKLAWAELRLRRVGSDASAAAARTAAISQLRRLHQDALANQLLLASKRRGS